MIKYLLLALTISVVCSNGLQLEESKFQRSLDVKGSAAQLINRLVNLLKDGFDKGIETYEKVVNDEDVKAILEHLGSFQRKVAISIINGFRDVLNKIDNATKTKSQTNKRYIGETSARLINQLVNILRSAMEQGREAFDKVVNDEDVKAILNHLGPLSRKAAEATIQAFKDLLDKIDNATKDESQVLRRDFRESSASLINKLVRILKAGFEQGREAFEKVVNDPDVKAILEHLGPLSRKIAESIIQEFKNILDKIDNATKDQSSALKRETIEPSERMIYTFVQMLASASKLGSDAYETFVGSEETKSVLDNLDSYSRVYAEALINLFRPTGAVVDETLEWKRNLKESSAHLINRLVNLLKDAFEQGRETFDKVVNDEDVQAILNHLGPLSKKIANSIIQGFKDILDKVDNATKDQSQVSKRDFQETSASLIKKLYHLLKAGFEKGREAFDKVLQDEDVKAILDHLGPLSRRVADSIIQKFKELLEKIDEATNDQPSLQKRDIRESSAHLINRLVNILRDAFKQGRETFDKVLNDEDVKAILDHLGPLTRKVADSIIRGFKDLLDRIDNATKDKTTLNTRDLKESTAHVINRLVNLLRQGFEGGREAFEKVINDPDVKGILEHLGPLSRRVAQNVINGFYDLLDQIDAATKGSVQQ